MRAALGLLLPAGLAALAVLAGPAPARAQDQVQSCVRCHRIIDDPRLSDPAHEFPDDIHSTVGLGCAACHGGNPRALGRAAKDRSMGYIGKPTREQIPGLCARCHSDANFMKRYDPSLRVDQLAEYRTSVHGQRLFGQGDTKVAVCTDCHPAHQIRPPTDPESSVYPKNVATTCGRCHADTAYMKDYGIPTDQLAEYHRSIHWETMDEKDDLSAPTCNDCHGNHGATPPEVSWIGNVCGQCHTSQQGLFDASVHPQKFMALGSPGCVTCHGNHAIEATADSMLGVGRGSVCGRCHDPDTKAGREAARMAGLLDSLKTRVEDADSLLQRAEEAGLEVSQAQFELQDARSDLVRARVTTHSASVDSVRAQVESGLEVANKDWGRGRSAFFDLRIRRLGLLVSSLIIVVLIVGLVVKIRERGSAARQNGKGGGR